MNQIWDSNTYETERRRLVPCFDQFYRTAAELIGRSSLESPPRILDLGAGTGILSAAVIDRIGPVRLHLLDGSAEMLQRASARFAPLRPEVYVQSLTEPLPPGPFDAIISALAIHHLSDDEKRLLYARILDALAPGGVFVNAEQVSGINARLQQLFEATHLDAARALGSPEAEIQAAIERMRFDKCAVVSDQIRWLEELGFENVDCFFRWFRFAVFGGWKPIT